MKSVESNKRGVGDISKEGQNDDHVLYDPIEKFFGKKSTPVGELSNNNKKVAETVEKLLFGWRVNKTPIEEGYDSDL